MFERIINHTECFRLDALKRQSAVLLTSRHFMAAVGDDFQEPRTKRMPWSERGEAVPDINPCLLHRVFGKSAICQEDACSAPYDKMIWLNQLLERLMVAHSSTVDQVFLHLYSPL